MADQSFDELRDINFGAIVGGGYYFSILHGYHFGFFDLEDFALGEGIVGEIDRLDYQMNVYSPEYEDWIYEDFTHWAGICFGDGHEITDFGYGFDPDGIDHGDGYYE